MGSSELGYVKRAEVILADEKLAVEAFARDVEQQDMAGVVFFCSADYDLKKLADGLKGRFSCPVIGCTSAGEIGTRYQKGGMVGASFSSEVFRFHTVAIPSLNEFDEEQAQCIAAELEGKLEFSDQLDSEKMFGLSLIDGLSMLEEQIVGPLYHALRGVSIVGGSAGDSLKFEKTHVYTGDGFYSNAAAFALIETKVRFHTLKFQHFEPTGMDMVITRADPLTRTVYEIDGEPAAEAYANLLGLNVKQLDQSVFSQHPLMIEMGNEWFVRAIKRANEDGSLAFICAIDNGLPLTLAKPLDFVDSLRLGISRLKKEFQGDTIELALGFDCLWRRLEMKALDVQKPVERLLKEINFLGFSTFGEQFNANHVNQTLTGVVIGKGR